MDNSTNNLGAQQNLKAYNKELRNKKNVLSMEKTIYSSKQNILYILNTSFLVIIAFIAGYNLNSWQMKKNIGDAIKTTELYLQKAKENYKNSEQLLLSIESQGSRHFEGAVSQQPELTPIKTIIAEPQTTSTQAVEKIKVLPTPKTQGITKKVEMTIFPQKKIPSVKILHTIKEGELLSSLVTKASMADFLKNNPQITDPDLVYPGQKIFIHIPKQSIKTGSYLNNYFIRSAKTEEGKYTYLLTKSLFIPESETLISYIIKQPKEVAGKTTTPYINLSDFTNTMKEEIWGNATFLQTRNSKINVIEINQTGTYFETINNHPVFNINSYRGIKSIKGIDYYTHIDRIKDYLIKYLASIQTNKPVKPLFHFLIFGETIVQVNYLEASTFIEGPEKSRILIGIVHRSGETNNALFKLQSTLSTCKSRQGAIIELSQGNFKYYQ